ncbi:MAG TPA: VTT domain-containing protein [Bacilli bacterium]|nr:VTT domain-containing protein [Bacilli bacterium]
MFHWIMDVLMQYGWIGLLIVSLAEASFLPVAPDLILIPLVGADPSLGFLYGALALFGSMAGSMFGHLIGVKAGYPILRKLMKEETLTKVHKMFEKFGVWAIVIAGMIPLPFKLFTIASGVFQVSRRKLLIGALIGRGVRYFGLVLLVRKVGVVHIPEGLETKFLIGLLVLVGLAAGWWYIRSKYGTWLRSRMTGLMHFFKNDFLTPVRKGSLRGLLFLVIGTLTSLMIAIFGGDVVVDMLQRFDVGIREWVNSTLHPGWSWTATVVDLAFSLPVVVAGYLFVSFVLLFHLRKRAKMRLFAGLVLGTLLMQVAFKTFAPNPVEETVDKLLEVTSSSLPSGQVMAAILLYTSLAYIAWITQKNWWAKILGLGISLSLLVIAPLSPVVLGEHPLSSTLGGLTAGILWMVGCLCTRLVYRYVEGPRIGRTIQ